MILYYLLPLLELAFVASAFELRAPLVAGSINSTSRDTANANRACATALKALSSRVVVLGGSRYESTRISGSTNANNDAYSPTCIAIPRSSQDVVQIMKAIYNADSNYAVRSGGHSAMKGWNTLNAGVLIDLRKMKTISQNREAGSITLGPGARWGDVYDKLTPQGVSAAGGRQGDVGVGGFLLGGGLSWLSPVAGFGCDTLRSVDVVLPSGKLVTASPSQNADLFRAVKGSGGRMGIVTRFEVDAIDIGPDDASRKEWYGGTIIFPANLTVDLLRAQEKFDGVDNDPNATALTTVLYYPSIYGTTPVLTQYLIYHGSQSRFNRTFARFLDLMGQGVVSADLGARTWREVSNFLTSGNDTGNAVYYGSSALYPGQGRYEAAYGHWKNFSDTFIHDYVLSVFALTPIPKTQIQAGRGRGGNAFAPASDRGYTSVQLTKNFAPSAGLSQSVSDGIDLLFEQIPSSPGLPFYLNESGKEQKVLASYSWYNQLRRVYSKYDLKRFNVRRLVGPEGL